MNYLGLSRTALGVCVTAITLAACGRFQPALTPSAARQVIDPQFSVGDLTAKYENVFVFNGPDGAHPSAPLEVLNGILYGTTSSGGNRCGRNGCGTVFSLTTGGKERVLYRFVGGNKVLPSGLIALKDRLYGTTDYGGTGCNGEGCGTVFSVTPAGKERVIYRFKGGADGRNPFGLTELNGLLYGTTFGGGSGCSGGCGTVFSITTAGKKVVLYSFKGGSDGSGPTARVVALNGALYGTTDFGGSGCSAYGCGTVFRVSTAGKERVLYDFGEASNGFGAQPGALTALNGTLYGTTTYGGTGCASGCGTIYSVTTTGTENLLHNFSGPPYDGQGPNGLSVLNGVLYGTTEFGGNGCAIGCGTIFSVTTTGDESVLYSFETHTGAFPAARMTRMSGTLYGTTTSGGSPHRDGTVFAFTP